MTYKFTPFCHAFLCLCAVWILAGCGAPPTMEQHAKRLTGATEPGEAAAMVIQFWNTAPGNPRPSSVLIAPNIVLTSGHAIGHNAQPIPASSIYLQQGTMPNAPQDPQQVEQAIQASEIKRHPGYVPYDPNANPSPVYRGVDLAVLRLACRITTATPARINRAILGNQHLGLSTKWIGYGPNNTPNSAGTKRSVQGPLLAPNQFPSPWPDMFGSSGFTMYSGDSGGPVFAHIAQPPVGNSGGGGSSRTTLPLRYLIGINTWQWIGPKAIGIARYANWISARIQEWHDPFLQEQPHVQPIQMLAQAGYPSGTGTYNLPTAQAGVTYTWSASNAMIVGSSTGTSVQVQANGPSAFQLRVTAKTSGGCQRIFSQSFTPRIVIH